MPSATSPLPACFNTHNKATQIVKHVVVVVANNKTKGNRDNQLAEVVLPIAEAVEMDSTDRESY
jgi:hypothetical protein